MPGPGLYDYGAPEPQRNDQEPAPPPMGGDWVATKLRPIGFNLALTALNREDCYKFFGFSSAEAARTAFDRIEFRVIYAGGPYVDSSGGTPPTNPPPAQNPLGTNVVQVNYDYNWLDFTHVRAWDVATNAWVVVDFAQQFARNIELQTLTGSQLLTLILLHEFRHTPAGGNAPQETDRKAFNLPIYEACVK
jgi:hypothetical protein